MSAARGVELVEECSILLEKARPGTQVDLSAFDDGVFVAWERTLYTVTNGRLVEFEQLLADTERGDVIGIDYRNGNLAFVAGSFSYSEAYVHDINTGERFEILPIVGLDQPVAVRSIHWLSDNELVFDVFGVSDERNRFGGALYKVNVATHEYSILEQSTDVQLHAVGRDGYPMLLGRTDAERRSATTVIEPERRYPVTNPFPIGPSVAISETEFIATGIDGLYLLKISGDRVTGERLELPHQIVSSLAYNGLSERLYLVSEKEGRELRLVKYAIHR